MGSPPVRNAPRTVARMSGAWPRRHLAGRRRLLRPLRRADVKPYRAVKAGLLMQQNVREFVGESARIFVRGKIAVFFTPAGDCFHDAADHLAYAMLSLGCAQRAAKIFRNHHLRRHQRPGFGNLDIGLLEDDLALFIDNRSGAQLPVNFVVRAYPSPAKIARYFQSGFCLRRRPF